VNATIRNRLASRKRQIQRRLDKRKLGDCSQPAFRARNIRYEIATRVRGVAFGGIGAFHLLVRKIGLIDAIDERLHLLKSHLPYHESDHVLNIAYNALCNGDCLQDIELRRNDAVFLDALGAQRIPDPTTAGDFCRRFSAASIDALQDTFDDVRIGLWRRQPDDFFAQAILDVDGSLVATTGQCKQGMDIAYNGVWGYHPLIVTLANTREVLRIVNRPGNRPSHEGAADALDRAIATCRRGGFRKILLRGDTDFSQTQHLDRWHDAGVRFIFGYDCRANLVELAEMLPARVWRQLQRPGPESPKTTPRQRPDNVKERVVRERRFEKLRLKGEDIADWDYQPHACQRPYRLIILRKNISKEKGELLLLDEIRYFFYLTNDWLSEPEQIILAHDRSADSHADSQTEPTTATWIEPTNGANGRCNQENVIQQLKNGMHALTAPVDNLESNWAYMVMTALAWNLKAWAALMLPEKPGRWREKHRAEKLWLLGLEFKTFVNALVAIPCQIIRQARRLVFRILAYNPHQALFFRLVDELRC
jgi:Transposase DDE domain group 1